MQTNHLPAPIRRAAGMNDHAPALLRGEMRRSLHDRIANVARAEVFSLYKVLAAMRDGQPVGGFEGELIAAANEHRGTGGAYMATSVIPFEVLDCLAQRDMTVGIPQAGGYMVQAGAVAPLVAFDGSVAGQLGVQVLPGQKQNIAIPKTTGTLAVNWLQTEGTAPTERTPTLGQSVTTPKVASVTVDVSDRLMRQGEHITPYINALFLQAARSALDVAVFAGTGTSGQPMGLLNDTSITSASGSSFNLASAVGIQKTVADNVVSDATARWAGATDVRQVLQQRVAFASTASPLWADDRMSGRPALASNRMPAGGLLYGDFTEVQALLWGAGVEIAVDPYTQFTSGVVTFRLLLTVDIVTPRPGALVRVPTVT